MPLRLRTTAPRVPPLAAVSRRLLSMGTPSTTISGSLLPEMEATPRRIILEVPPRTAGGVTTSPATLPARLLMTLLSRTSTSSSPSIPCTE